MDINELESFELSDAVKFHDKLNPSLWTEKGKLDPEVREQLMLIAKDFMSELGVSSTKVEDITLSGSNAAYTYTPHSDLDLHILVDFTKLPDDKVYQELFKAKKTLYNDMHDIKVHGVPVEVYVQDSNEPVVSLGEYSLIRNEWLKYPKKSRANFNQNAARAKYEQLGELIEIALKTKDLKKVEKALDIIKRYRKAGLDTTGEFGPENLAFKALRKQGYIEKLWDLKNNLHSRELSIEDYDPNGPPPGPEFKPTMPKGTIRVDVSDVYDWYKLGQHISNLKGLGKHDFGKGPPSTILSFGDEDLEHKYIDALKKTGLDTTDIDPKAHDTKKGQKVDPTYNVNEILDKGSAAKVYWSEENYMTGGRGSQAYTLYTAAAQDKNKNILKYNFYYFPKYDLTAIEFSRAVGPWGDNFSIDNAGDQYTVFATLIETVKQYLSDDKPEYLYFGAKEPSRAKLYQTFVNRFANKFGYKQISPDNIPKTVRSHVVNSGDTPFLLAKTESVKEVLDTQPGRTNKAVWDYSDPSMIQLNFVASNGQLYLLDFLSPTLAPDQINEYDLLPDASDKYYDNGYFIQFEQKYKRNPWKQGKQGIEGTGAAAEVFGVVTNAILQFVKKKKPTFLYFQAAESNRISLYSAIVKKILPSLPGWKVNGPTSDGVFMLYSPVKKKITKEDKIDYMAGHCHVLALALKKLHPNWKLRAHIGWDDDEDEDHRVDHIYIVSPDGSAYDCRGKFSSEQELVGPDKTGGVETQLVDYSIENIKADIARGELKKFTQTDISNAMKLAQQINENSGYIPSAKEKNDPRFKTALTVDVKPDSIKKNAKAFNSKVNRAGIPPQARTDGKIK